MKRTVLFFATFAALVSCTKDNPVSDTFGDICSIEVEASAPIATDADTKTTLVENGLVRWSKGDAIKVLFFPNTATTDVQNKATHGATAILTSTFETESSEVAWFRTDSWSWGDGQKYMNAGIALYPSSLTAKSVKPAAATSYINLENEISYELPSTQVANQNSFQSGVNLAYAPIYDKNAFASNSAKLQFSNACALIKLILPESLSNDVISVSVESKNDNLSGTYAVDSYDANYNRAPNYPLSFAAVSGKKKVTLESESELTLVPGGVYYIVTWPGTHDNGLVFTFTNKSGLTCVKSTTSKVELEAGVYDTFKFTSEFEFTEKVPELTVSTSNLSFTAEGGSSTFDVTSNFDWTTTSDADWLIVSPSYGGETESSSLTVTATQNTAYEARTATITVSNVGVTKTITVTQEAAIRRYKIKSQVTGAGDLATGKKYVILFSYQSNDKYFEDGYCWKAESNNNVSKFACDKNEGFTEDCVFEFTDLNSTINTATGVDITKYVSKINGRIKSVSLGTWFSASCVFGVQQSSAHYFVFANQWDGENGSDIDIWYRVYESGYVYKTLYSRSGSLAWGGTGDHPRKWYIYEVE